MAANMRDLAIATVNLLNLTVPGGLTYDENKPDIPDTEDGRRLYERRIGWLARAVERLDADVICFQELWKVQALNDVFAKVTGVGAYDLVARDAPGIGKPQVAMAVRKNRDGHTKVQDATWIDTFPDTFRLRGVRERDGAAEEISVSIDRFSRPVLRVVVQPEGRNPTPPPVTFYGCHLKSKGGTRLSEVRRGSDTVLDHHYALASSAVSHTRRVLEAAALRALLDGTMASINDADLSPTVVLGDLNDGTLSISTELITGQPSYRVFAKSTAGAKADKGLYTVETLQQYRSQTNIYYTYIFRNKLESLDHVLVSEEFYDHSSKRQWSFRELEVYNDHLNTSDKARIDEVGSTDHGIVRAYFDWNPMSVEIAKLEQDDPSDGRLRGLSVCRSPGLIGRSPPLRPSRSPPTAPWQRSVVGGGPMRGHRSSGRSGRDRRFLQSRNGLRGILPTPHEENAAGNTSASAHGRSDGPVLPYGCRTP